MPSRFWRASGNALLPGSNVLAAVAALGATWAAATDWSLTNANLTAERTANTGFWRTIHSSTQKTNGTIIFTINALDGGSFPAYIGFDTGAEDQNLGHDGAGAGTSIGWTPGGAITTAGGTDFTTATWTVGDQLKLVKAGSVFSFYKFVTGSWSLLHSVDLSDAGHFNSTIPLSGAANFAVSNGNNTGTKITITDASGW